MLISVVTALAAADGIWLYWLITVGGLALTLWQRRTGRRAVLSARLARGFVLIAFASLIIESTMDGPIVMALSHFMTLVVVIKWLQAPSARDEGLALILLLLLLAVAAIVSGSLLFPLVLAVYLLLGPLCLFRHLLDREAERTLSRNRQIVPHFARPWEDQAQPSLRATYPVAMGVGLFGLAVGSLVFLAAPRVGAGMFGELRAVSTGHGVTGLGNTLRFDTIGPVKELNRSVMRVQLRAPNGQAFKSTAPLYYRGSVLEQYTRHRDRRGRMWQWERQEPQRDRLRAFNLESSRDYGIAVTLLRGAESTSPYETLEQHYHLEPGYHRTLFACYPPLAVRTRDLQEIQKSIDDQALRIDENTKYAIDYVITSAMDPGDVAEFLHAERGDPPTCLKPDPQLPNEQRILDLIDGQTGDVGPLEDPAEQYRLVRRLEAYLKSGEFTYTLEPPPMDRDKEPVSQFLFDTRRGSCEHFASALAIMCQLKGIPARLVSGYLEGEYNPVGQFYAVREKHAHAWVEAFIPGRDWVRLDSTPAAPDAGSGILAYWRLQLKRWVDYFEFQWASRVVEYDANQREDVFERFSEWLRRPAKDQRTVIGAVAAFVRELFGWRLQLSWKERVIYWVFTLLVVTLTLLLMYVAWVLLQAARERLGSLVARLRGRYPRREDTEFYSRFCRQTARLGIERKSTQTPAEFAMELTGRSPLLDAAPSLVEAYYAIVYGGESLPPDRLENIDRFLERLGRLNRGQFTTNA